MRKLIVLALAVVFFAVIVTGTASAQQYPNVANLKPFSAEADFMSLAGYLRYVTHQQTGQWMTTDEAARVVKQQTGQ
jgi:hypothetical protein